MRTSNDILSIKEKNESYLRNHSILLRQLSPNILSKFLKDYIKFLLDDNDIYIHKFLFKCKLINNDLFNKLDDKNLSVFELATTTEFELSKDLDIGIRKAFLIKITAQFHYANLFGSFIIYYAHTLNHYIDSIEEEEIKLILKYFPFATVINPHKLEPIWRQNNCTSEEIMKKCLDLVSDSDMVIFSPFNDSFISKGEFEEVDLAENLNIPCYLIWDGKPQDYILGEPNENDWKNYCAYKPVLLIKKDMFNRVNYSELEGFLRHNNKSITKNITEKNKKYIFVCNNTVQLETDIRNLIVKLDNPKFKILPILGKNKLCTCANIHDGVESHVYHEELEEYPFFDILKENMTKYNTESLVEIIKKSTPEKVCPYSLVYQFVGQANIILLNKIFFRSIRLRTKLRKEILFDNPFRFILVFHHTIDLFNDNIESRCSEKILEEAYIVLQEKNNEKYRKARLIIRNLLDLKEGSEIEVEYFLSQFLLERYRKRTENINILESIYDICKTPFGNWKKQNGEILQIINAKSLKNFLNYFFKVHFIESRNKQSVKGSQTSVRV